MLSANKKTFLLTANCPFPSRIKILFRGELILSEVTGREEMYYPTSKTRKKIFMVSVPVTIACLR